MQRTLVGHVWEVRTCTSGGEKEEAADDEENAVVRRYRASRHDAQVVEVGDELDA